MANRHTVDLQCSRTSGFNPRKATQSGDTLIFGFDRIWSASAAVSSPLTVSRPHNLFNPLKPELNPICYLLALLAHHFLHVSRVRVKLLNFRLLMSYIYIYMEHPFLMFLDHTQRHSTVGRTPLDE